MTESTNGPGQPGDEGSATPPPPPVQPQRSNPKLMLATMLLVIASVALPYYFWRGTWFGSQLTRAQMQEYLAPDARARDTQHALAQFAEHAGRGDVELADLIPAVVAAGAHGNAEVRQTAAWAMGTIEDEAFQVALAAMLEDPAPLVRRNAALSLAKFRDPRSRPTLHAMMATYDVVSPVAGTIVTVPRKGSPVRARLNLVCLRGADGELTVRSPLDGAVAQCPVAVADVVAAGDLLCRLSPDEAGMYEALRAFVLVGTAEDAAEITRAVDRHCPSRRVADQAELTLAALARAGSAGD